jgi:iron(II)-dependent oxidoreductase
MYTTSELIEKLQEARLRTLRLVDDLDDEQMIGPRLRIVNPLRWEIGHVAWFQEYWLLRHLCGRSPRLAGGDALYDSAKVAHDTRWDLKLPRKSETIAYTLRILDDVMKYVRKIISNDTEYFLSLALFHEDMHGEAITYTRQTPSCASPGCPGRRTSHSGSLYSSSAAWEPTPNCPTRPNRRRCWQPPGCCTDSGRSGRSGNRSS